MSSITNLQFSLTSLQFAGQESVRSRETGGGFDALLSSLSLGDSDAQKKTYHTGNLLNVDLTAFGIGESRAENDPILGLIDQLFEKIRATLDKKSNPAAVQGNYAFPFTPTFEQVFGTNGGPLFDFIDVTTKGLGLSAEKNLALQNIAINNKDIIKTPASVAKIDQELRSAGIV